jgi:hypothetical protein
MLCPAVSSALELAKDRCLFRMPGGTLLILCFIDRLAIADITLDR